MARKPQVNLTISEEQKHEWEQFVDENNQYSSLADLARQSTIRTISNEKRTPASSVGINPNTNKEIAQIKESVETLHSVVGGLSNDFQEMKGIIQSQKPTTQHLKSEIFALLPEQEPRSGEYTAMSAEEIASEIGGPVDIETVSEILSDLAWNTGQVEEVSYTTEEGENVLAYYKKGDKI